MSDPDLWPEPTDYPAEVVGLDAWIPGANDWQFFGTDRSRLPPVRLAFRGRLPWWRRLRIWAWLRLRGER